MNEHALLEYIFYFFKKNPAIVNQQVLYKQILIYVKH